MNPSPCLLTLAEAAEMLRISVKTLREHIDAGELACIILGRGRLKKRRAIDHDDLRAFIIRHKETGGRAQCPSTSRRKAPITTMISNTKVIGFTALRAQRVAETRKP
jgi:excisionase family DNA binding protein